VNKDEKALLKLFPTRQAWAAADKAADALPPSATMQQHIDTWLAAYKKAGGKTKLVS
jgi:hypothetical protein